MSAGRRPSVFTTEFDQAVDRWASQLPLHLQSGFRAEFRAFGGQYEAALDTLESIWERRERAYGFDEFTGLATRGSFHEYLTGLLDEPPVPGFTAVGVLFIDVNNLKRINDTSGHPAGDRAIATVGTILRDALRDRHSDRVARVTDDAYAVGRHGGDEFVAALPLADASEIELVATRVKQRADDPGRQRVLGYTGATALTISLGAVVYEVSDRPAPVALNALATALLAAADSLMYESKRDGLIHVANARFTTTLETFGVREIKCA